MSALALDSPTDEKRLDEAQLENVPNKGPEGQELLLESAYAHTAYWTLIKQFWRVILLCLGIYTGAMFDGYAITVPGSVAANKSFINYLGEEINGKKVLNAQWVSAWGGMSSGCQIIGMVCGSFSADKLGRRFNFCIVIVGVIIAFVLEMCTKNWLYFLFARGICAVATGMAKSILPVYVAEIAPSRIRSGLLVAYCWFYTIGQFCSSIALQIVQEHDLPWRNGFYPELVFLGCFIPMVIIAPESPWFYANKFDHENAKKMLLKINGNVPGYDVEHEYAVLAHDVEARALLNESAAAQSWYKVFQGSNLRRTWISTLPLLCQHSGGGELVLTYASYFFSLAGVKNPFNIVCITQGLLLVGLLVAAFTVDKIGRRPLLIGTMFVQAAMNFGIGAIGTQSAKNAFQLNTTQSNAIIALSCIWMAVYSMGVAPLGYAYASDTSTAVLRAKTTAYANAIVSCFALLFSYCTPLMLSAQDANWGGQVGYFYGCLAAINVVLFYFTIPETRGRSFIELDEMFDNRVATRKFG